jgi:hypothetical protein
MDAQSSIKYIAFWHLIKVAQQSVTQFITLIDINLVPPIAAAEHELLIYKLVSEF